jgi:hypothetical protein
MSQGAAQLMVRIPPAPVAQMLPQLTFARQAHEGADPQPPGSGRQAYDGVLPGTPPMVTWQYVVATLHDEQAVKSVMKAYDIGQDFAPRWLFTLRSDGLTSRPPNADLAETGSCNVDNDFSAALIAGGIANVGFFFYRQEAGDSCSTNYVGWVSPGFDFTTGVNFVNVSHGGFPYQEHGGATLTDYTSGMRTWLPGFAIFPVWTQPLQIAGASGAACNVNPEPAGFVWSARVLGARVVP